MLAATPFEVTTMAGRRIRSTVLKALAALDVFQVAVCGLSNAYCGEAARCSGCIRVEWVLRVFDYSGGVRHAAL